VRNRGGRARAGLRIHRVRSLRDDEVTTHHGIPVTTPERTLLDLAATLEPRQVERALDRAEILRLIDHSALDAVIAAHASHREARRLKGILTTHRPGTTLTKSELEEVFLRLCETHHLPRPRINTYVESLQVDFVFHEHRVAVETDGWNYHRTRRAFERDRERDATLTRAGLPHPALHAPPDHGRSCHRRRDGRHRLRDRAGVTSTPADRHGDGRADRMDALCADPAPRPRRLDPFAAAPVEERPEGPAERGHDRDRAGLHEDVKQAARCGDRVRHRRRHREKLRRRPEQAAAESADLRARRALFEPPREDAAQRSTTAVTTTRSRKWRCASVDAWTTPETSRASMASAWDAHAAGRVRAGRLPRRSLPP
jgi:hypothetical protein